MREIKFRLWNTAKKMWCPDDQDIIYNEDDVSFNLYGDRPEAIIMQYTGLKDRNGKEIYEGDILRFTEVDEDSAWGAEKTYITQVKWIDELADWRVIFPSGRRTELHCILQIPCFYDQEIIGNVHENPELLETK